MAGRAVTNVPFRNQTRSGSDRTVVSCEEIRDALSARADGEVSTQESAVVDRHLESCSDCRAHAERIERLDRLVRVRPAEPVPDLVGAVTARARPARLGRGGWMRPALAWVAVVMLVQSVPPLVLGELGGIDAHFARHLGAFGTALAIGFAFAAWKPHRAFGLLPFTAALVATTLVSIGADVVSGTRTPLAELLHVTELAGLVLLWMIAGSPGWHGRAALRRDAGRRSRRPIAHG
jgi:predicted anti-sigma-YlaC factor YlaD